MSQDIEWYHNKYGHNSGTNVQKLMCNNPNVDLVNMNAYIKFGEILSFCSQDIEQKRNFGIASRAITLVLISEK